MPVAKTSLGGLAMIYITSLLFLGLYATQEPPTPAAQYKVFVKEFSDAAQGLWNATTDEERVRVAAIVARNTPRLLELVEKNPKEPFAFEALAQVITQESWLENNTSHPGLGKDSPSARAIALLIRDHIQSDKLSHATWRAQYGFRKECETLLRAAEEKSSHKDVQALACLRLGQFLTARQHRVEILRDKPEMAARYEELFGKEYLDDLRGRDRSKVEKEIEAVFERAIEKHGGLKHPWGGTIGERAKSELFEIRNLTVGKTAPDIEGEDQDGRRFKLSDYRGKAVLLYFWSEI